MTRDDSHVDREVSKHDDCDREARAIGWKPKGDRPRLDGIRKELVKEEEICDRCLNTGIVQINGGSKGKIGCRKCGRGDEMVKRIKARRKARRLMEAAKVVEYEELVKRRKR